MNPHGNPYFGAYPGVYNPGPNMVNQPVGQAQGQPQVNNQTAGYVCRPVTSREEAVASQVDFLGPGTIMPDFGHGMIYFKRFNPNSGGAEFFDFSVQPPPQAQQSAPMAQGYDPRGDIEALRGDFNTLRGELDEMKKAGQKRTGGKAGEQ